MSEQEIKNVSGSAEEEKYLGILKKLTLEEKAALCSGLTFWTTTPLEKHGVPSVRMTDGPHGLRSEKESGGGTNIMKESHPATCFPPAVTSASTWDPELLEEVGNAIALEAKALGVSTVLGPGVNIKRSPLCGRNFEYFSEDPFLAGRMGAAWVHGVQKNDVGVSLKHFCANNQEHLRMSIDTIVDERALREIYLPAFEHIVKTEQPATVMCSYNRLNGTFLSDNKRMLTDILRDEWGFKGIVVSDWGAVNDRLEGIRAGMDLEMPGNRGANDKVIVKAVKDGVLAIEDLDKVVLRMIKFAFECKASEDKSVKPDFRMHDALAARVAANGAVLLKNDEDILPLSSNQKIAVIGALAKTPRYQGAGSSLINPTKVTSFLDAMDAAGQKYEYADGYKLKGDGYKAYLIDEAVDVAKGKDAVIVFVGLTPEYESEGFDRRHLNLPDSHYMLVDALSKVNENVIVVLSCGSPVALDDVVPKAKAILNLYLGGQSSGRAAYALLFGKVSPCGKLAETFPLKNGDNIVSRYFPMGPRSVQYRESVYVGYRYYDSAEKEVLYPFGYGLTYTKFEYSDLRLSSSDINEGEDLTVTFKLRNTGNFDAAEIAQIYVSDVQSSVFRPKKELKGFKKVFLKAGLLQRPHQGLAHRERRLRDHGRRVLPRHPPERHRQRHLGGACGSRARLPRHRALLLRPHRDQRAETHHPHRTVRRPLRRFRGGQRALCQGRVPQQLQSRRRVGVRSGQVPERAHHLRRRPHRGRLHQPRDDDTLRDRYAHTRFDGLHGRDVHHGMRRGARGYVQRHQGRLPPFRQGVQEGSRAGILHTRRQKRQEQMTFSPPSGEAPLFPE